MASNGSMKGLLTGAAIEEIVLVLSASLYLDIASLPFLSVIVVSVFSFSWIVARVRAIDRHDRQALYGQPPGDA